MQGIKLYLEGPGQERRSVRVISTEHRSLRAAREVPVRWAATGIDVDVEMSTLVDEEGNVARQIDREGFRYRFDGSEMTWSLVVG